MTARMRTDRRTGPCHRCQTRTWSVDRVCRACRTEERRQAQARELDSLALTDGSWQPKGLVMVWVPNPRPIAPVAYVRRCSCGAALEKWKQLCPPCATESRRASWRASRQRRRTAA